MAENTSQLLADATYGGVSKLRPDGLLGAKFDSLCPPVITRESIILAVGGPHDLDNTAAPEKDGWFLSDFFLLKALYKDTAREQYWMTCVAPSTLVDKYTRYLHGHPTERRKIVLDAEELNEHKDVLVFHPDELRERYLAYFDQVLRTARGTERPILLMMFGHGYHCNYGISIGGETQDHLLKPEYIKQAILRENPRAQVTVLTTSCYSGGWCIAANGNTSNMHGVEANRKILSYPISKSIRQASGSPWITAVARALCRTEVIDSSLQDIQKTPSYALLTKEIHSILLTEVDTSIFARTPSFAAQDDIWAETWRKQSGVPLTEFKKRYNDLRTVPEGEVYDGEEAGGRRAGSVGGSQAKDSFSMAQMDQALDLSASIQFHETLSLPLELAKYRIKKLAGLYMASFPGTARAASNKAFHHLCNDLITGFREISVADLQIMADTLHYRLVEVVAKANQYREFLGASLPVDFPSCQDTDCDTELSHLLPAEDKRHAAICDAMRAGPELFEEPIKGNTRIYMKGHEYLELALLRSQWSIEEIPAILEELIILSHGSSRINHTIKSLRLWNRPNIKDLLQKIAQSSRKRLRVHEESPMTPTGSVCSR